MEYADAMCNFSSALESAIYRAEDNGLTADDIIKELKHQIAVLEQPQ